MPHRKLIYFNARGRAELSRVIMAYGELEYEDVRIEREQWAAMKPSTTFGQLPVLEVDGETISQSNAIARYLASEAGLVGKNVMENAKIDMIVDFCDDMVKPLVDAFFEKDEEKKKELFAKYKDETLPGHLEKLEKILDGNKDHGVLVGDKLTWADLKVTLSLEWPIAKDLTDLAKCPRLKALHGNVLSKPKIAEWIKKRPETQF